MMKGELELIQIFSPSLVVSKIDIFEHSYSSLVFPSLFFCSYNPWHPCFTVAGTAPIPEGYSGDTMEFKILKSNLGTRAVMNRV